MGTVTVSLIIYTKGLTTLLTISPWQLASGYLICFFQRTALNLLFRIFVHVQTNRIRRVQAWYKSLIMPNVEEMRSELTLSGPVPQKHNGFASGDRLFQDKVNGTVNSTAACQQDKIMPIAIVGMSCRFPHDSSNPEKLWEMLCQGRSAWSNVPADRFNQTSFYHPNTEMTGAVKS